MVFAMIILSGVPADSDGGECAADAHRIWDGSRSEASKPPRWSHLSEATRRAFTRGGAITVETSMFVDDSNDGSGTHYSYSREDIDAMVSNAFRNVDRVVAALKAHVRPGHRVLVVGTQVPRYEAVCVALGAETTTVEYNRLTFDHPMMRTVRVVDFSPEKYDVILSASSLDHDGLGRYGDPIAPDGDLLSMDQYRPLANLTLLTVPVGPDLLAFNLMRIYGATRLPLLLAGYDLVATYGFVPERLVKPVSNFRRTYEPVFALRPAADPSTPFDLRQLGVHEGPSDEAPRY
ncbi:hypothetical protein CTAYLR_001963 [Chrysophaeum taylorii]|uniref:Uncharacterized protein n=1 Tax=Chrysophaeum taylorii TaxID=2483200 RepID=A0AAD7U8M3_9STRA|nr:hypothetical protein CTAYLR_001963 [Chrysophaeum taylorii]